MTGIIRVEITDDEFVLPFWNKNIYNHLANLCKKWDKVVDIYNGKDGPHSPENVLEM